MAMMVFDAKQNYCMHDAHADTSVEARLFFMHRTSVWPNICGVIDPEIMTCWVTGKTQWGTMLVAVQIISSIKCKVCHCYSSDPNHLIVWITDLGTCFVGHMFCWWASDKKLPALIH